MGGGESFDILVVGGGSAGCVLAGRLAEGGRRVGLIEAGPDYGPYREGRWPADMLDGRRLAFSHAWETDREDRSQLRARIVGGCSAHNACVMLPARRPTTTSGDTAGATRRSSPTCGVPSGRCASVGSSRRSCLRGTARSPRRAATPRSCIRSTPSAPCAGTPAFAYLDPVRERENLTILADTLVDRVLLDGDRAVGVATSAGELRARRRRAGGRRVRLAGDPAAQRYRPGARAARRRRAHRPRRGRLRLRGHGPAPTGGRRVRALAPALHGAGHGRALQQRMRCGRIRSVLLPRPRSPGRGRLRGERRRLRDEAGVPRLGQPELERPPGAAEDRPWLPLGPRGRGRARRGRRVAAPARGRGPDPALRRAGDRALGRTSMR